MRLFLVQEAGDEVVTVAHQERFTGAGLLKAPLKPSIQYILQVDVRQHRRAHTTNNLAKLALDGFYHAQISEIPCQHWARGPFRISCEWLHFDF